MQFLQNVLLHALIDVNEVDAAITFCHFHKTKFVDSLKAIFLEIAKYVIVFGQKCRKNFLLNRKTNMMENSTFRIRSDDKTVILLEIWNDVIPLKELQLYYIVESKWNELTTLTRQLSYLRSLLLFKNNVT